MRRTGLTSFSGFTVGGAANTVLPVKIEFFTGAKQDKANQLNWKVTCVGSPSVTLVLERSNDGRNFGQVYTSGSVSSIRCDQPFSYSDDKRAAGVNYYRVKMIDADGKVTYSDIVTIFNNGKSIDITGFYPNPVKDIATLSIESAKSSLIEIKVSDIAGRVVLSQKLNIVSGSNQLSLNLAKLAAGTYQVTASADGTMLNAIRFVKQ